MRIRAAQFVLRDDLTGDLLDTSGPVMNMGLAGLDDESVSAGLYRTTGAGAGDDRDLRHDAGQLHVGETLP